MSKTITFRYETAHYDDASLSAVPPAYPTTLEAYRIGARSTTANSYATMTVTGAGNVTLPSIPAGATVLMLPDAGNTVPVALLQGSGVAFVPGGSTQALSWPAAPNQPVTLPGVLNQQSLSIQGINASTLAPVATAFTCQLIWWL